ncbi:MAG: ABC transporter, partial [Xanthomonadales bacterium]|nr:ABC transporter [Xanthomonadales bacterium]
MTTDASTAGEPTRRLSSLRALWPFLRPYRRAVGGALLFLLLSTTASLILPAAVGQMIDHGFSATDADLIDRYFLALFAVAAVLALATAGRFYFVSWLGERVMADLRRALFNHLLRQEIGFFEQTRVGELQSRLTADTELIQTVVGSSASVALRSMLMLVGALGLLVATSPKLSLLIVIGIPAIVAPILLFGRRVQTLSRQSQDRLADTSAVAGEALGAIATVQAFARESHESERYGSAIRAALGTARRRLRMRAGLTALVILLVFGAVTLVLWFGAQSV